MSLHKQITRARAVALLTELVEAFGRNTFQRKLKRLVEKSSFIIGADTSPLRPIRHLEGRQALVFKAQRDVLQKYGFSSDKEGILAMKTALRAHLADRTVAGLSREARRLLRIPQMQPIEARADTDEEWQQVDGWLEHEVGDLEEFAFLASPNAPDVPPSVPAPLLHSASASCRLAEAEARAATRAAAVAENRAAAEQRMTGMDISVTNPMDQRTMRVTVSRQGCKDPTVAEVKAAITAQVGEHAVDPAIFQLVINNGKGVYGTRPDTEIVRLDRVLAIGVHMACGAA